MWRGEALVCVSQHSTGVAPNTHRFVFDQITKELVIGHRNHFLRVLTQQVREDIAVVYGNIQYHTTTRRRVIDAPALQVHR